MASGDTKTQQYLDIAARGTRADLQRGCCNTRTQDLIMDVAERIITEEETRYREDQILQSEIDEIKNNPDVYDIVPTYAALQNYDTSKLTDQDIIRVLADETHEGASTYYRWSTSSQTFTYVGETGDYYTKNQVNDLLDNKQDLLTAGDGITIEEESGALVISSTGGGGGTSDFNDLSNRPKYNGTDMTGNTNIPEVVTYSDFTGTDGTTAGQNGLVPAPATTDAGKFLKADGTWAEVSGGGGGTVKILSESDYNWNSVSHSATAPFDSIAPWLLYTGVYQFPADVYVSLERNSSKSVITDFNNRGVFVSKEIGGSYDGWMAFLMFDSSVDNQRITMGVYDRSGIRQWETAGLVRSDIANNLTTSAYYKVLSAAQGKVLNEKITPTSDSGAPTTSTVGSLGKVYIDTSTDTAYMCVKVSGSTYTWKQITA